MGRNALRKWVEWTLNAEGSNEEIGGKDGKVRSRYRECE